MPQQFMKKIIFCQVKKSCYINTEYFLHLISISVFQINDFMKYRKLGKTNLAVSLLAHGLMRLPIEKSQTNFTQAIELIKYAVNNGINFFDVGTFYCHYNCEKVFGMVTKEIPDNKILICGKNASQQTQDFDWLAQLYNSLTLFHRKYLDIYFIHYLKHEQWENYFIKKGVINQIQKAKNMGLIKHIGFSSHDTPGNVDKLISTGMFDAVILPFNLLQREYENSLRFAYDQGLGVIIMNPLAGGVLASSKIHINNFSENHTNDDLAELSLNYVMSQPFVHCVLSGMESKQIIDKNILIVNKKRMNSEQITGLNDKLLAEKTDIEVLCTGCNYCIPCTQGIDIPKILDIWNQFAILKGENMLSAVYSLLPVSAECCIRCDSCVDICPQHIPISEIMAKAEKRFLTC